MRMRVVAVENTQMVPTILIQIIHDGLKIFLTLDEARDLRDYLLSEPSVTPPTPEKAQG